MSDFRELVDDVLFNCTEEMGEEVTFYPKSGGVYKVRGIFDNAYQAVDPDTQEIISANQSIIGVNLNDFKNNEIKKGDQFKIRNMTFRAIDSQEDGQGGAMILLHKIRDDEKTDLRKYPRSFRK